MIQSDKSKEDYNDNQRDSNDNDNIYHDNDYEMDGEGEGEGEDSNEVSNERSNPSNSNENDNNINYNPTRGVLILKDNTGKSPIRHGFNRSRVTDPHSSQVKKIVIREESEVSDEEEVSKNFRQIIDKFLSVGRRHLYLQFFLTIITTISFIFYIFCTYFNNLFYYLNYFDLGLCFFFFLDYLLQIILSHHYLIYLISIESIINLLTMIPPIFYFFTDDYMHSILYIFINFTRVFRVLRIFRIFSLYKNEENNVYRQIMMIIITILQVIFISAGIVQLVEYGNIEQSLKTAYNVKSLNNLHMRTQFHHYVYFVVVTVSTVGYGDIYPFTPFGKAIFMVIVLIVIVLLPYQTNDLIQLMSAQSDYTRDSYKASREIPHIILTGDISLDSLRSFSQELFHPDHGTQSRHAVIICPELPSRDMEIFLHEKQHENVIRYLQGNPLNEKDLLRADCPRAKACIIFNNKNSKDPHTGDHQSLFLGIFIKKFVWNYLNELMHNLDLPQLYLYANPQFRLCMQLNKPESSCHFYNTLQNMYKKKMKPDQLIVIESIKMNLLSKSCLTPGIMALITNLVMSAGNFDDNNEAEWMKEYAEGRGHEIYRIPLLNYYKKWTFLEVVKNIYEQEQAITFALEIEVNGGSIVKLNPTSTLTLNELIMQINSNCERTRDNQTGNGTLKKDSIDEELNSSREKIGINAENSNVRLYAYLICSDKAIADKIANNQDKDKMSSDNGGNTNRLQKENTNKDNTNNNNNITIPAAFQNIIGSISQMHTLGKGAGNPLRSGFLSTIPIKNDQSDSDSDDNSESENNEIIQFGSSDMDFNRNEYYFNLDSDHYLKNNVEIMHHSIKDREDITNHIIICGLHPALVHFILPLRAKYLQEDALKWIVILAPSLPQHLFESFTKFPRIIFIQGSPLLPENLFRANIINADKAVILSSGESKVVKNIPTSNSTSAHFTLEEQMLDAETIFIYKAIKKCNKSIQIMTELICTSNIEYLLNTSNLEKLFFKQDSSPQYEFTPIYASGEVFTPSIIDRITCQSFYNPHIITIIELILGGDHSLSSKKSRKIDEITKMTGSNLYLVKIPDAYVNESFEEFFSFLINHHNSIGIALYRKNIIEGFYYVYTNPKKTTLLRDCDFVFVLSNGSSILDLIDERPLGAEINDGINDTASNDTEESIIEEEDNVEVGNLKDNIAQLQDANNMVQPRKRLRDATKKIVGNSTRTNSRILTDQEGLLNQLTRIDIRKQFETTKHADIEHLKEKLDKINSDLISLKNAFNDLPKDIDELIDKEFHSELMIYLSKN